LKCGEFWPIFLFKILCLGWNIYIYLFLFYFFIFFRWKFDEISPKKKNTSFVENYWLIYLFI
jgi:hypothetical protein